MTAMDRQALWLRRWRSFLLQGSAGLLLPVVMVADQTVAPMTVSSGQDRLIMDAGKITTTSGSSERVVVSGSGSLILWSKSGVDLKPGFHANSSSFFWAAVDSDMNGYSDQEEITDTDGDGMPDAWEVDHGLNPIDPRDASMDRNGDGSSNLTEYRASTPGVNQAVLPDACELVLRIPSGQYYGVDIATWDIRQVNSP